MSYGNRFDTLVVSNDDGDQVLGMDLSGMRRAMPNEAWLTRVAPLALLAAGFVLLAFACLRVWGAVGWPIGSFWWDELALVGAAEAVRNGMLPTVDFWSPFVLPIYIKRLAIVLVGYAGGYVAECLIQGGVALLVFFLLVGMRRQPISVYFVGAMAVLTAVAPFNLLSTAEAQVGFVSFSCAYNRLGGALISLILLIPALGRNPRTDNWLIFWVGGIFLISFLLKITVFQIEWLVIFLWGIFARRQGWMIFLFRASLVAVAIGAVLWLLFGGGYFSALKYLSNVRMSILMERPDFVLLLLVFEHRFELGVLLLAALLIAFQFRSSGLNWLPYVLWYLAVCACVCGYTITNYGDNGVFPAVAALCTVLLVINKVSDLSERSDLVFRGGIALLLRRASHGLLWLLLLFYFAMLTYWSSALLGRESAGGAVSLPLRSNMLAQSYRIEPEAWINRFGMVAVDLPINLRDPRVYAGYLAGVDEANQYLESHIPDRSNRVYALDFPSYVFSYTGGYRVPKHTFPWLLYGHEITLDHHPAAEQLFSDVDILMVSKCSASGGNRKWLFPLYRVYIDAHLKRRAVLRCWDVYQRGT